MKSLICAFSMVFSLSVLANAGKTHNYTDALGAIQLDNACITDSEVKSINQVKVCTKLVQETIDRGGERGTETTWKCVESEYKDLAFPRAFERTVCVKYNKPQGPNDNLECLQYGKKADFLPAVINVLISRDRGADTVQKFSFPACN
jgi:hypothetical protein